jgi:6-phosphogluconolactonase
VLDETDRWVAKVYLREQDMYRVTLTAPLINHARDVVFLVSGANKAPALHQVLQGPFRPHDFPAQLIRPREVRRLWLVDKTASHRLAGIDENPA